MYVDDPFALQEPVQWIGMCTCCGYVHCLHEMATHEASPEDVIRYLEYQQRPEVTARPSIRLIPQLVHHRKCTYGSGGWSGGCNGRLIVMGDQEALLAAYQLGGRRAIVEVARVEEWHRKADDRCPSCQLEDRTKAQERYLRWDSGDVVPRRRR